MYVAANRLDHCYGMWRLRYPWYALAFIAWYLPKVGEIIPIREKDISELDTFLG